MIYPSRRSLDSPGNIRLGRIIYNSVPLVMILAAIYFTFAAGLWIISPSAADWWLTPVSILTRILKS